MAAAEGMMPLVSKSALLSCLATSPKRNCRIKNNETRVLRRFAARLLAVLCLMCLSFAAQAAVCVGSACTVTSAADLVTALTTVDNNPGTSYTVTFTSDVTLAAANTLPAINSTSTITIDGGGHILDGGGVQRGFFVYAGTVTIQNLTIQKAKAAGGIGLAGGGGGAGLGGAIFVTSGAGVTLNNVSLLTNQAAGGNAALAGYTNNGGGGGMGGNSPDVNSGGGGGLGLGADGGNAGPGLPGIVIGAAGGGSSTFAGGASGGGGGYGFSIAGGGGVGGSSASPGVAGGNGGFGGGGGGGGGNGGFGGGGAGAAAFQQPCGAGGFGGGGGGVCNSANPGPGGFGGGGGTNVDGGGGLGAGGAIFVQQGGTLTLTGPLTVNGSTVVGGSSTGHSGLALGSGMFIQGNGTVTFTPSLSQTQTFSDAIADQTGSGGTGGNAGAGGLTKSGAGTLILAGANSYTGGTTVSGGTLQGTTTSLQGNITDNATVVFNQSTSGTYAGIISGSGDVTISGSGGAIVTFSGANTYTGATNVLAGTLLVNGSLANTSVTVASGATVCGTGTISGNVTVKAGGTLCATLTVTGTTTTVPTTQAGLLLYVPSVASSTTSAYTTNADGTLTAVTMLPGFAGPYAAAARGDQAFAYITNSLDNTIRVVDTGSNTIVQTLAVGAFPIGVAISPDGKKVYVANHTSNSVSLFSANPVTGLLTAGGAFGPGTAPRQVVVSPDGSRIYVVNQGTGVGIGTIGVFDASTNILLSTVTVGLQPLNAAINPAGTRLYVTNFTDSTVSVIDTGNNTVIATVSTGSSPDGIVVSPDGAHYYVANRTAGTISQFNTSNNAPIAAAIASGSPEGLVVSPDGNALYASDIAANTVKVFGVASGSGALVANGSIAAGTLPLYLSMCRDGNAMLAAGATFVANTVAAIGCAGTTPTFTGGTLLIKGAGLTISSPLTLGSGGGTINPNGNTATISGVIGGSGGLTLNGTGTLVLAAADTYAGGTTVTSGTLQLGAGGGLTSSSGLTVNGGVFDLNGQSQNVSALSGSSGGSIALGAGTLTVNQASATTYAGVLSGSGSVIKSGAGVLTLTGGSTYSGGTTIAAGTLTVDGSLTNSTVTIDNGATLCGTGTVKNVVVNPGGILCNTVIVSGTLTPAPTTTIVVGSPLLVPPATPQTFTATVAASGIPVPGGTVTFVDATTSTTLATVAVNVAGQASITVTLPGGTQLLQAIYNPAPGYVTSSAATTVTVQQLLAVTVQSVSITYGSAIPALSCAIAGAVQPGDVVTVSCATTATSTSPVGTYAITPRLGGAQAGNYIASGSGTITIVPAMLTITADDFARVVGTANPVFTGVISGIQNNDAVSATYATAATQASVTGTYPIVPSVVGSASILANYSVKTVVGTLTIVASDIVPQTGWWWDPTESGMGFVIERQGTDMFLASVAYNADGAPTWILSNGPVVSSLYVGKLHMYRSGQTLTGAYQPALDDGAQGTIQVQFLDPANAKLTWFGRTITLQRLSFAGGTAGTVQNGWWWNPAESGRGFGIEIEGSAMFMAGLMFNAEGAPTWYLATGPMASATQFTGVWQQYGNGPTFEGCLNPFFGGCGPTIVTNPNAGSVSVTFTDASHGTLTLPDGRQIPIQRLVF